MATTVMMLQPSSSGVWRSPRSWSPGSCSEGATFGSTAMRARSASWPLPSPCSLSDGSCRGGRNRQRWPLPLLGSARSRSRRSSTSSCFGRRGRAARQAPTTRRRDAGMSCAVDAGATHPLSCTTMDSIDRRLYRRHPTRRLLTANDAQLAPEVEATKVPDMSLIKGLDTNGVLDPSITEVLVSSYGEFLRFLERRVGTREVAEDILQETFAQSLDKLATLRDSTAVRAWFYRALRNAAIDYHRRRKLADRVQSQLAQESDTVEASPEAALGKTCQCATRVARQLRPEYAEAIQRVELDDASLKRFAEERQISTSNAAVRVFRARDALRRALVASCGTSAAQGCSSCGCEPEGEPVRSPTGRESRPSSRARRARGYGSGTSSARARRSARGA
jgi:RNA polymerase sigma factor (sigma-70 family)